MIANINLSNAIIASITLMSVVDALPAGGYAIDTTIPAQATRLEAYVSQKYDNTAQATSRLASYISDKQVPTATLKTLIEPTTRAKPTPSVAYDPWYLIHPTSATYDDGKYHPPTQYDDGKYGKPTKALPIPSHHPLPEHDFPVSWVAPITAYPISDGVPTGVPTKPTYPISDGVPTGVPTTTKKAGLPTVITDYFPQPTPSDCTSNKVGLPTVITDTFPVPTDVSILPIPTKITSFVTRVSSVSPETTEQPYTPDEKPDYIDLYQPTDLSPNHSESGAEDEEEEDDY